MLRYTKEAVEELSHVSERARVLALNMLSPEEAARIVHALPPRVRRDMYPLIHPRAERLVMELIRESGGERWEPAAKLLALVEPAPSGSLGGTRGKDGVSEGGWEGGAHAGGYLDDAGARSRNGDRGGDAQTPWGTHGGGSGDDGGSVASADVFELGRPTVGPRC